MEASFFVNEDALKRGQSDMRFDEAGLLRAFDLNRERICAVAAKVYGRAHKGSYDLLLCELLNVSTQTDAATGKNILLIETATRHATRTARGCRGVRLARTSGNSGLRIWWECRVRGCAV
jgi:hypothetical protein